MYPNTAVSYMAIPTCDNNVALTGELIKHDFIAENVRPLSRLTLILDMTRLQLSDDSMR